MNLIAAILALFARSTVVAEIIEPVAVDNVVPLKPVLDQRLQYIRTIAALRLAYKPVPAELTAGMAVARREWLKALDSSMLTLVAGASQSQLIEHLAGRRAIRGVLAADPASVTAYLAAMMPKVIVYDPNNGRRGGGGGPKHSMGDLGMKFGR